MFVVFDEYNLQVIKRTTVHGRLGVRSLEYMKLILRQHFASIYTNRVVNKHCNFNIPKIVFMSA